ncbi:MAG: DNA-3-methyladenine glycosylase [Firmicutes bacterium]|nr:DNA-3-methyladenine glycosylase [Bacillota bacterium]
MRIIDRAFFKRNVVILAQELLGKVLCRKLADGQVLRIRITETEAYGGADDSASHASHGMTKRNAPMFGRGGTIYVYLCYGIHEILNIISGEVGDPQGVMIRGVDNLFGPGKVTKALCVTRELCNHDITNSQDIWLEDDGFKLNGVQELKRVGIGYASTEDQDRLWRFRIIF